MGLGGGADCALKQIQESSNMVIFNKDSMKIQNFIVTKQHFFDPIFCKQIINTAEKHEFQEYRTDGYCFDQLEINGIKSLSPLVNIFYASLTKICEDYFASLNVSEFISVKNFESVRIKRYKKNSFYRFDEHIDATNIESCTRYLICLLYLNTNNGSTVFWGDYKVEPEVGKLVLFPPFWMFPHKGNIPTDEDKYIMMTSLRFD